MVKKTAIDTLKHPRLYRKAIGAGVVTLASAIGTALLDGSLTVAEVTAAVGTALLAGAGVFTLNNDTQ